LPVFPHRNEERRQRRCGRVLTSSLLGRVRRRDRQSQPVYDDRRVKQKFNFKKC
jgi:hypothetical protein